MNKVRVLQASTFNQALRGVLDASVDIVSRLPLPDLKERVANLTSGMFDFDGTLTTGSQWEAISSLLPDDLRRRDEDVRFWYWNHRFDEDVPDTTMDDPDWFIEHMLEPNRLVVDGGWAAQTIMLYEKAEISREQIRKAMRTLPMRTGAFLLLRQFDHRVVISFGMEQPIQIWLRAHQINSPVAATRLIFNDDECVAGFHQNIVASSTKGLAAQRFRTITGVRNADCLVVGDSMADISMMHDDSFNVLIIPPSEMDKKLSSFREGNLGAMWNNITMILCSDSLMPLANLIVSVRKGIPWPDRSSV